MDTLRTAALALTLAAGTVTAPASAGPPPPGLAGGRLCQSSTGDETSSGTTWGVLSGGPAFGEPGGRLRCTIRVVDNWDERTHLGPAVAAVESEPAGATGISLVADVVTFPTPPDFAYQYVCTSYVLADGTLLYWARYQDTNSFDLEEEKGYWTTDPDQPCVKHQVPDERNDVIWEVVDRKVCSVLIAAHTELGFHRAPTAADVYYVDHEGDVFVDTNGNGLSDADWANDLVYDCPSYTFDLDSNSNPDLAADGHVVDE